nr:hypothetical protein [Tanacetum cinerariifolium]
MHNNIMAAGSGDRPPMLAMGRYAQWRSRNKTVDTTLRYKNDNQSAQFRNQRIMTFDEARENVGKQSDLLADTDEDIDEQELEAHYSYMAKIQEVPTADSGTNSESLE